jgi:hypothetical protein
LLQQEAIRRPLRYFTPADRAEEFPWARLASVYTLAVHRDRLSSCQNGLCDSASGGVFISQLELAVGPGEHPCIHTHQRVLAPEACMAPTCGSLPTQCWCPPGYQSRGGGAECLSQQMPMLCTETQRITEQAGVIRGLPLHTSDAEFSLFSIAE